MLKELKVKLEQVRGVEVSQATISRALHNYGYSGKKVSRHSPLYCYNMRFSHWRCTSLEVCGQYLQC